MKQNLIKSALLLTVGVLVLACNGIHDELPIQDPLSEDDGAVFSTGEDQSDANSRKGNSNLFGAFLTGREEVPAVNSSGAGSASFEIVDGGSAIKFQVRVSNIEGIIFAHIHKGAFGENGPVMVDLIPAQNPSGLENGLIAEGVLTASDLKGNFMSDNLDELIGALMDGMAYVNLHTSQNPPGEIRGQLSMVVPSDNGNFTSQLTGAQEVPSVNTRARGVANFRFSNDNSALPFQINVSNLEDVLFSHIHLGKIGENGPVVANLKSELVAGRVNGVYTKDILTSGDLSGPLLGGDLIILREAFRTGNAYVNVHTANFPSGELRGQL